MEKPPRIFKHLPWDQFDPNKVNPSLVPIVKAAALVEYNAHDYAHYLCKVFMTDGEFQRAAKQWSLEEIEHGESLGHWAELADPSFNFKEAFARFTQGYQVNTEAAQARRGSQIGELIARCVVETGTSSYYTALAEASEEPVLKILCRAIAGDEFRHYSLFYDTLKRYIAHDAVSPMRRLAVGMGRILESEDDELAYAFFAANAPEGAVYDRKLYANAYAARAYPLYRPHHIKRVVAMVFKACGVRPNTLWQGVVNRAAWWALRSRVRRAAANAA